MIKDVIIHESRAHSYIFDRIIGRVIASVRLLSVFWVQDRTKRSNGSKRFPPLFPFVSLYGVVPHTGWNRAHNPNGIRGELSIDRAEDFWRKGRALFHGTATGIAFARLMASGQKPLFVLQSTCRCGLQGDPAAGFPHLAFRHGRRGYQTLAPMLFERADGVRET
jgi:hypothetical protein